MRKKWNRVLTHALAFALLFTMAMGVAGAEAKAENSGNSGRFETVIEFEDAKRFEQNGRNELDSSRFSGYSGSGYLYALKDYLLEGVSLVAMTTMALSRREQCRHSLYRGQSLGVPHGDKLAVGRRAQVWRIGKLGIYGTGLCAGGGCRQFFRRLTGAAGQRYVCGKRKALRGKRQ